MQDIYLKLGQLLTGYGTLGYGMRKYLAEKAGEGQDFTNILIDTSSESIPLEDLPSVFLEGSRTRPRPSFSAAWSPNLSEKLTSNLIAI